VVVVHCLLDGDGKRLARGLTWRRLVDDDGSVLEEALR